MTTTINVSAQANATIIVTRHDIDSAGELQTVHSAFDFAKTLNDDSTPAATKKYAAKLSGNQNLDLTALADPELGMIDASGLKLLLLLVNNLHESNDLTISDGAANPYQINGGNDLLVVPGGTKFEYYVEELADVAAGAKAIDFSIAAGDYEVLMIFG